eukprot:TRINITY_DN12993_c0_g1_i1.p1 TRINITY_DN12993_c0_g1~~TRINITY_DN12993_c0_g1_i1.p1  ORF type:complete len:1060 (-),score=164.10 TRINITY_DN12993_c0_g1_i1:122-3301(-)
MDCYDGGSPFERPPLRSHGPPRSLRVAALGSGSCERYQRDHRQTPFLACCSQLATRSSILFLLRCCLCGQLAAAQDRGPSGGRFPQTAEEVARVFPPFPYDFSFSGEVTEQVETEIIGGNVEIYGNILEKQIQPLANLVMSVVSQICQCFNEDGSSCTSRAFEYRVNQDLTTLGKTRIGLFMEYWLLPAKGGGAMCTSALAYASQGSLEPPFDPWPKPTFRKLVTMGMVSDVDLFALDASDWYVELKLPFCRTVTVVKPTVYGMVHEKNMTGEWLNRTCGVFTEAEKDIEVAMNDKSHWVSSSTICGVANTACVCAATEGCTWTKTGGGMRCIVDEYSVGVSCDYCSFQIGCPVNRTHVCATQVGPCSCALNTYQCWWHSKSQFCFPIGDKKETTTCIACAQQEGCKMPTLMYLTLGARVNGNGIGFIDLTFDRRVRLRRRENLGQEVANDFVSFECPQPDSATLLTYAIGPEHISFIDRISDSEDVETDVGNVVLIDPIGTKNMVPMECEVVISDSAFEGITGIPVTQVLNRSYHFLLGDMAPPIVESADPKNNAVRVPRTAKFSFTFNEEIFPGPYPYAKLYIVGGGAEHIVASIDLSRVDVAVFKEGTLIIDMERHLRDDTLYSIVLPPGCLGDVDLNLFAGLPMGSFTFRTARTVTTHAVGQDAGLPTWVILASVLGLFLFCVVIPVGVFLLMKVWRQSIRVANVAENTAKLTKKKSAAWDGSFFQSYVQNEQPDNSTIDMVTVDKGKVLRTSKSSIAGSLCRSDSFASSNCEASLSLTLPIQRPRRMSWDGTMKVDRAPSAPPMSATQSSNATAREEIVAAVPQRPRRNSWSGAPQRAQTVEIQVDRDTSPSRLEAGLAVPSAHARPRRNSTTKLSEVDRDTSPSRLEAGLAVPSAHARPRRNSTTKLLEAGGASPNPSGVVQTRSNTSAFEAGSSSPKPLDVLRRTTSATSEARRSSPIGAEGPRRGSKNKTAEARRSSPIGAEGPRRGSKIATAEAFPQRPRRNSWTATQEAAYGNNKGTIYNSSASLVQLSRTVSVSGQNSTGTPMQRRDS